MKRRWGRKLLKRFLLSAGAVLCFFLIAATIFSVQCTAVPVGFTPTPQTKRQEPIVAHIPNYARPEDDTFLTYPEWFIVWSYQEKADFQRHQLPAAFPYLQSIRQYWCGYCLANRIVRGRYPFNTGDHLMLVVIGTSFSLEYGLKGLYENTIGRLSEWASGHQPVEEDVYAYQAAQEYAHFVHIRPFYEFPFFRSFRGLWKNTSLWGTHPLRKWERKLWLSLDYGVEALYCGLIEKSSHAVYGIEDEKTYALIENASDQILRENPRIRQVKQVGPQAFIVALPRYQEFTDAALRLAKQGVHFTRIAGNEQILLTAVVPQNSKPALSQAECLFSVPIATDPTLKRIALRSPVCSLHNVLNSLSDEGVPVEHIYDY